MKLVNDSQEFEGQVPAKRMAFGFSANSSKMFGILSDGIYRDKIAAVIRELGCNAYDAHVVSGNKAQFKVQVPSHLDPTFMVEDQGTGIDPDKIGEIFWTYGDSTKTHNNDTIGALGLGSKSPFAYTKSSFTVKNRYNGKEHIYFCFIDETGCPAGSEVSAEPTDKPNGITVELAVRSEDVYAFHTRLINFYKHWPVKPEFVGSQLDVPSIEPLYSGNSWYYEKANHDPKPLAIMGNVPYPIDLSSIPSPSAELDFVANNNFRLIFPIGALSFQVSREELSYDGQTVKALDAAAKVLVAEIKQSMIKQVEHDSATNYDLWYSFKKIYAAKNLRGIDSIGGIIAAGTVFTSLNGDVFTKEQLLDDEVKLTYSGLNPFPIMEIVRYTNSASLRNRCKVIMEKEDPTTKRITKVSTNWFLSSLQPRVTKFSSKFTKQPADYLHDGYTPKTTIAIIPFTDEKLSFLINDVGYQGAAAARMLGRKHAFYFVDVPKDKTVQEAVDAIKAMTKGKLVDGMEVGLLSQHPRFVMPESTKSAADKTPKVRGMVEVRLVSPYDKNFSKYEMIDPQGFEAYYITTSSKDREFLRDKLPARIRGYTEVGFVKDIQTAKFICRNQADIDLLIKKGAKLTSVYSLLTAAELAIVQDNFDKYSEAYASDAGDYKFEHAFRICKFVKDSITNANSPVLQALAQLKKYTDILENSKMTKLYNIGCSLYMTPTARPIINSNKLNEIYPLLEVFDVHRINSKTKAMVAAYINDIDAAIDAAAENNVV